MQVAGCRWRVAGAGSQVANSQKGFRLLTDEAECCCRREIVPCVIKVFNLVSLLILCCMKPKANLISCIYTRKFRDVYKS